MRITFRGADIYTVGPPAAGGLVIGEILKIVYERQLDNQVRTLEEAIESARRIMGSS